MGSDAVVLAFLERLAADRREGSVLSLASYQDRYPGFEDAVASAYACAAVVESSAHSSAAPRTRRQGDDGDDDRVGPYRLIDELGRGGQGVVYRALDVRIDRPVALKVLTGHGVASPDARRRFRREAAIASRLSHPNICTVYEADTEDGIPYIAMEVVEGRSLAALISEAKARQSQNGARWVRFGFGTSIAAPPPSQDGAPKPRISRRQELMDILTFVERIARTLHHAHEVGIVHRDVKPGNIMVTTAHEPVLMDFGLARLESGDQPQLTLTGDFLGTPAYMSPEQLALGGTRLDRRTDVYSLGATLYECLTLTRPFEAPTREALQRAILTQEPVDPRTLNPGIPPELKVVLERALEKDRDRRYQSAEALADELRRVRNREPILARPIGPLGRLTRWARRNPAAAGSLLLTLVFLTGVAGVYAWKNAEVSNKNDDLVTREKELSAALGQVREETIRTQREMDRVTRLKDRRTLRILHERAAALYPPLPERLDALETWLRDAERLIAALPGHRAALAALEERAGPYSDERKREDHPDAWHRLMEARARLERLEDAKDGSGPASRREEVVLVREALQEEIEGLEVQVSRRVTWSFDDDTLWIHELLTDLVAQLAALEKPGGVIDDVRGRLARARALEPRTLEDHASAWEDACRRVRGSERYGGLEITPQLGLIPIGPDPGSGLEEFLHWLTHVPGHPLPRRNADGRLPPMDGETGIILVLLPGNTFVMGSTRNPKGPNHDPGTLGRDTPPHEVTLGPFFMGKHELTRGQWTRLSGRHDPSHFTEKSSPLKREELGRHPVNLVSWLLCRQELYRVDLLIPTEARWEYACRAGTDTPWSFGKDTLFPRFANLADKSYAREWGATHPHLSNHDDGYGMTAPVGSFEPNAFGLHDMHGNVAEWTLDLDGPYTGGHRPGDGMLLQSSSKDERLIRGGCLDTTTPGARSADRPELNQAMSRSVVGVRAARDIAP